MKLTKLIQKVAAYDVYEEYQKVADQPASEELLTTITKTLSDISLLDVSDYTTGLYISVIPEYDIEYNITGDSYRVILADFKVCFYDPETKSEISPGKQDWSVWANSKIVPKALERDSAEFLLAHILYEMHWFGFDYEKAKTIQSTYTGNIMEETPDDVFEQFFGYSKEEAPGRLINADPDLVKQARQSLEDETEEIKKEYYGGL